METGELVEVRNRFLESCALRVERIEGLSWEAFDTGPGSPTLVTLPGAVGGGEASFFLAERLRPRLRVVALNLPAFSTIDQAIRGLRACLQARGVRRPILLGASYSGLIVQAYVRAYPDEVRAIILSHTGVLDPARVKANERAARVMGALPLGISRLLLRGLVRALTRDVPDAPFWRQLYRGFNKETPKHLLVSRYLLTADLCASARWTAEDLRGWSGRVLIIDSNDDRVASRETRARLHALYPRAEVATFPGTGHSTAMARPVEYAETIRRFVETAD